MVETCSAGMTLLFFQAGHCCTARQDMVVLPGKTWLYCQAGRCCTARQDVVVLPGRTWFAFTGTICIRRLCRVGRWSCEICSQVVLTCCFHQPAKLFCMWQVQLNCFVFETPLWRVGQVYKASTIKLLLLLPQLSVHAECQRLYEACRQED
jgi:hypothetical protein